MAVIFTQEDRALTAQIAGDLDHHAARGVIDALCRQIDQVLPKTLTIDMGGVTFMDSSGIAVLLRAKRQMEMLGGSVAVHNVPRSALKVLVMSGIDRLIAVE